MAQLKKITSDFFFKSENEGLILQKEDIHYCLDFIEWSMKQDGGWENYTAGLKDYRDHLWSRWQRGLPPSLNTRGYFRDWIRAQVSQ